jgi:hypothetical protein
VGTVAPASRPSDGGGLPRTEADLTARMTFASEAVLTATLERAIRNERVVRSQLDFIQMQIRVVQTENARRHGVTVGSGYDPS